MKTTLVGVWLACAVATTLGGAFDERAAIRSAADEIDRLIEQGYEENHLAPNPMASPETLHRRLYLTIAGRIPTLHETKVYLDTSDVNKSERLIETLLDSEAYVSHSFNYWADLLRIQSRMRNVPGNPYIDWVKDSIRANMPYDQFVRELITAEGYIWENGAAGFYLRDQGMELDHMANTFQVFLGTQLVCAQCHDHPYDSWTQMDYYQQAAFSYGVKTTDPEVSKQFRAFNPRSKTNVDPKVKAAARRMVRPLRYRVWESKANLRLPADYQYEDAKPRSLVKPSTIFGKEAMAAQGDSRADRYADWMTADSNPRFATVIANRLWKRAMGVGLVEPVDDLSDSYQAANPALLTYLTGLVQELGYDLKKFQQILYNTKTFQREVTRAEWDSQEDYHFPGPVLRRMTAEQIWDSVMTLIVPNVDARRGERRRDNRYQMATALVGKSTEEVLQIVKTQMAQEDDLKKTRQKVQSLQRQLRAANKKGQKQRALEIRKKLQTLVAKTTGAKVVDGSRERRIVGNAWEGLPKEFVRASEVASPAPPGHFLRQFGQSDREVIENANADASVPQALSLMNGPGHQLLTNERAVLNKILKQQDKPEKKVETIYLSVLNRLPQEHELSILNENIHAFKAQDLLWALINGREFLHVQ